MGKGFQQRRGNSDQHAVFNGEPGEITINTDRWTVVVQDGTTNGGYEHVNLNANQRITNKDIVANQLSVTGVSTFAGISTFSGDTLFAQQISVSGVVTATSFVGDGSLLTGIGGYWEKTNAGINTISSVGIGTTNPQTSFQVDSIYGVKTGFGTFSATVGIATDIDMFTISATNFKTSHYTLFFNNGDNIQALKLLVMQNGSQAYYQEFGGMFEPNQIVSVAASITSGVCKLTATPETGISGITTYKFTRETIL